MAFSAKSECRVGTASLRMVCTTDLHMHLAAFDFYRDCAAPHGLEALAEGILAARATAANVLTLDNGDMLQGTPIADFLNEDGMTGPHPMIAAMNAIGFDAGTLGNHDFDFGIEATEGAVSDARFPVICANVVRRMGAEARDDAPFLPPCCVIERQITLDSGASRRLRIGLLGVMPKRVEDWNRHHLEGRLEVRDPVAAVAGHLPALRPDCDLVVVLTHAGIVPRGDANEDEQCARAIAELDGVDALIAGHQHMTWPPKGPGSAALEGKPAIMAHANGRGFGVLDLRLEFDEAGARVTSHSAELRRAGAADGDGNPVSPLVAPVREATRRFLDRPVGRSETPLETHFSSVAPTDAVRLLHAAQLWQADRMLGSRGAGDAVLLSMTAAFLTGIDGGMFTKIPAGPLTRRHVFNLYPFENHLVICRTDGAGVAELLEMAAGHFNRLDRDAPDQELLDPLMPGFNYETISGLSYRIDLSRPARYDRFGTRVSDAVRIRDLTRDGRPVDPGMPVLLALNSYRAAGGGGFAMLADCEPIATDDISFARRIEEFLRASRAAALAPLDWGFAPLGGVEARFDTGSDASVVPASPALVPLRHRKRRTTYRITL